MKFGIRLALSLLGPVSTVAYQVGPLKMSTAFPDRAPRPLVYEAPRSPLQQFSPLRTPTFNPPQASKYVVKEPLPEVLSGVDSIDRLRAEVEDLQEAVMEAVRVGDLPGARALYHGSLQDTLHKDPLYTLHKRMMGTKSEKKRAHYEAFKNLVQKSNTRRVMFNNKIAVLLKGGNGLELVDGRISGSSAPSSQRVVTSWTPSDSSTKKMLRDMKNIREEKSSALSGLGLGRGMPFGAKKKSKKGQGPPAVPSVSVANVPVVSENPYAPPPVADKVEEMEPTRQFQMPTWSPDGRYLAFTELYILSNGLDRVCLVVYDAWENREAARKVLNDAPHMLVFMPDSDRIVFMANGPDKTIVSTISVREMRSGLESERVIDEGVPVFFAVSKYDSKQANLIVHNGKRPGIGRYLGDMTMASKSWHQLGSGIERKFRAPDVVSAGPQDGVIAVLDNHLVCMSLDGKHRKKICRVQGFCTFAASPNGKYIALMEEENSTGFYQMSIISGRDACNPYGGDDFVQKPLPLNNVVASFYFSPDSKKLLLMVTTSPTHEFTVTRNTMNLGVSLSCSWMVYFMEEDTIRNYGVFNPRPYSLKAFIPFFDQYRFNLSPWSPDSKWFCYTQRDGAFIQRLDDPPLPENVLKQQDRLRRGKRPDVMELDDPAMKEEGINSAYKLGKDLELLSWSWN